MRPVREALRRTIDRSEAQRIPGSFGDALRALQNLPGMARPPFFAGTLVVRGAAPSETQAFVDGTPLPLLYHFGGLGSTIPTELIDRLDLYPSNPPASLGRATGGVVDVALRTPRTSGYHGVASIGVIDTSLFVEGPLGPNVSLALGARYGWLGRILSAANALKFGDTGYAIDFADYQGVLEWRPTHATRVRLALFGDRDALETRAYSRDGSSHVSRSIALQFHLAQLSVSHQLAPHSQLRLAISGGFTRGDYADQNTVVLASVPFNMRYELSHEINAFARVRLGADVIMGPAWGRLPALRSGPYRGHNDGFHDVSALVYQPGLYLELDLAPLPTLHLVPSMRFDYTRSTHEAVLSPRAIARWNIRPDTVLRAGIGLASQPPRLNENSLLPVESLDAQDPAIRALRMERATHYDLGVEYTVRPGITASLDGFYKSFDHVLTGVVPPDLLIANESPPRIPITSLGDGRAYGLEVLLRARIGERFFGWIAYTLMRAERRDGPTYGWRPFDYDQTHNLTVVASANLGAGWEAGLRFRYVTGRPTTSPMPSIYDADHLSYISVPGSYNGDRLPDFHQLDLRIEKRWRVGRGLVGLFLEVLNVYNRANVEGWEYGPDGVQRAPIPSLPIVPNLGLRGEI